MFPQVPNTQIRLDLSWRAVALSFFHIFKRSEKISRKYSQNIFEIFATALQNIHIHAIGIFIRWLNIRVLIMNIKIFQIFAYNCLVDQSLVVKSNEILSPDIFTMKSHDHVICIDYPSIFSTYKTRYEFVVLNKLSILTLSPFFQQI